MTVLNEKQEKFAQARAKGVAATEAYRMAGYKVDAGAASNLSKSLKIRQRVIELQAKTEALSALTKEQAMAILAEIIITPAGDITKNHRLCQEWSKDEIGEMVIRTKVKMPSKMDALKLLGSWCGWENTDKIDAERNVLAGIVYKICTARGVAYPPRMTLLTGETNGQS